MAAIPIRYRLLRELFGLSVLIPAAVIALWAGLARLVRTEASDRALHDLRLLDARISERFERIELAAKSAAFLWSVGSIDPEDLGKARFQVISLLHATPHVSTLMLVGYPSGRSLFAWREADEDALETIRPLGGEKSDVDILRTDASGTPTRPLSHEVFEYAPLRRPWAELAFSRREPAWTEPYVFATFPRGDRDRDLGMTFAVPVRNGDGEILGLVGADVRLDGLSELARALRPTPGTELVVLDGKNQVVASASWPGSVSYLHPPGDVEEPVIAELLRRSAADSASPVVQLDAKGTTWFGRTWPSSAMAAQGWRLALAIPEAELVGQLRLQLIGLFAVLALLLAVAVWRIVAVTRALAGSLNELAGAARTLGRGDTPATVQSDLKEVAELSAALALGSKALEEHQRLQEQLLHSQRVGLVGFLAGGFAHDLNNQLMVLMAGIGQARDALGGELAEAEKTLREMEHVCEGAASITKRLLGIGRRSAPSFRPLDLNKVVGGTAELLRPLLDRRVKVETELAEGLPEIHADRVQLEQVLLNLALNARDAMPNGGTLRFTTRPDGAGAMILVSDTGTGMTDEVKARIFEPFFTTKEPGKGTGLGLAMISSIVREHGGQIGVETAPGKGTAFTIRLLTAPPEGVAKRRGLQAVEDPGDPQRAA